jgi:small-conductance mechanosensitive channel
MNEIFNFSSFFSYEVMLQLGKVALVLLVGFVVSRIFTLFLYISFRHRQDKQRQFVLQKLGKYTLAVVTVLIVLKIFAVDLKVILGAAGVLSLAIGFAAQTSISNLISGLFLIFERPFVVGDSIEVNGVRGEVLTVDLLSMRIRTVDNVLVRVPNEVVMKSQVMNYSHFPIRRFELVFSLAYYEDLEKVKALLLSIVDENPYCLDEPEPLFLVQKMGEYFLEIKFCVWGEGIELVLLQNSFSQQVRLAFIKNNIALPIRSMKLEESSEAVVSL